MTEILANAPESKPAESNPEGPRKGPLATVGVRVLLVSGDIQIIDTLCESMGKMSMHVDICSDFASAAYKLCHSKFEARQIIVSSAGTNFDPTVVDAFVHAFEHGEMEIPEALVV